MNHVKELIEIYNNFTEALSQLSMGDTLGDRFGENLLYAIGTGHYKYERKRCCDNFTAQVDQQIGLILSDIETSDPAQIQQAISIVADLMLKTVPVESYRPDDLMVRAMVVKFQPLVSFLPKDRLRVHLDEMEAAYPKRLRMPVERNLIKEMKRHLK